MQTQASYKLRKLPFTVCNIYSVRGTAPEHLQAPQQRLQRSIAARQPGLRGHSSSAAGRLWRAVAAQCRQVRLQAVKSPLSVLACV